MLVAFYVAARLFMGTYCLFLAWSVPMVRGMMISQASIIFIPSMLWIGSIFVDLPLRFAVIAVALFVDLTGMVFVILMIRTNISARFKAWADRVFEFYPATNIEHKVERTNAFVTLVFGYSVVAIIYQSATSFGLNAFYGKAVLGLIQAFSFNWIYFDLDGADLFAHAIRRHVFSCECLVYDFSP
jgi:low temperature requirement protein LtrA